MCLRRGKFDQLGSGHVDLTCVSLQRSMQETEIEGLNICLFYISVIHRVSALAQNRVKDARLGANIAYSPMIQLL